MLQATSGSANRTGALGWLRTKVRSASAFIFGHFEVPNFKFGESAAESGRDSPAARMPSVTTGAHSGMTPAGAVPAPRGQLYQCQP